MTRKTYIELRNGNELGLICYNYYVEKARENNFYIYHIKPFIEAFNKWMNLKENRNSGAIQWAVAHYDSKFNVQSVIVNGRPIRHS